MDAPSVRLPYSDEVLGHLLAESRQGSREALGEIERAHQALIDWMIDKYRGRLPYEQLQVCARFGLEQAARHGEAEATEFALAAAQRMRLEIEQTLRYPLL